MLSVIVPIYNGREYVRKCINSILCQEYVDMEVICVDDGSCDDSLQIITESAQADSRIRVIHKNKNEGLVAARKTGVNAAKGEYTAYVDCDDWIEQNMFYNMMSIAVEYDVDIVTSGTIYEGEISNTVYDGFDEGLYEGDKLDNLKSQIFFSHRKYEEGIRSNLVNKIYRTDLLRDIQNSIPNSVSYGEDRVCSLKYLLNAKSVYVLHRSYYHYIVRKQSMSCGGNPYYLDQVGFLYRELLEIICGTVYEKELKKQCGMYIMRLLMKGINDNLGIVPKDVIWLHPSWIDGIPVGSKIVLYGCGRRGRTYYRQIKNDSSHKIEIVAWVDKNYKNINDLPVEIVSPEMVTKLDYDYIVVSIENNKIYSEITEWLSNKGVNPYKVLRPMPKDTFWEFAESAGLYLE